MKAKKRQKMENMQTHLKTQGYCCQVCWVALPVCNHEVMLRVTTVLAIMVVMVMLMVVVLVLEKMMKKKQSTCQVDRDDQQAKS